MNKIVLVFALLLASCTTTPKVITQYQTIVVTPPDALYNCPNIKKIPNADTLTNQEVAVFIKTLYQYNKTCGINMDQIKKFVEQAKKAQLVQ